MSDFACQCDRRSVERDGVALSARPMQVLGEAGAFAGASSIVFDSHAVPPHITFRVSSHDYHVTPQSGKAFRLRIGG